MDKDLAFALCTLVRALESRRKLGVISLDEWLRAAQHLVAVMDFCLRKQEVNSEQK